MTSKKKEEEEKWNRPKINKKGRQKKLKNWKTKQSTKINLIGCDTIVNSPSCYIIMYKSYAISYYL